MIHPCDGRTDGRAIAYTRYSIYAVARKNSKEGHFIVERIPRNFISDQSKHTACTHHMCSVK